MVSRLLFAAVIALVPAVVVVVPSSVSAADEVMCQGKVATIVSDSEDSEVQGTEGDDVIASRGDVDALGGDDTICALGQFSVVLAGAGNDSVSTADESRYTEVVLGEGDDTFAGGPGADHVAYFFDDASSIRPDAGNDVIDTGLGNDLVTVGNRDGITETDRVDLGPGNDALIVAGPVSRASSVAGNDGRDSIRLGDRFGAPVLVDLLASEASSRGAFLAAWRGFEDVAAQGTTVTIRGTGRRDQVTADARKTVVAKMGGGSDSITILNVGRIAGRVDAGPGRDLVTVMQNNLGDERLLRLDLTRGRLRQDGQDPSRSIALSGVEDASIPYDRAVMIGNSLGNHLTAACGQIRGGGGNDTLRLKGPYSNADRECRRSASKADGGPGNDRLFGSPSPDVLIGGPGRDRANGAAGKDRCAAEVRTACERR